MPQTSQSQLSSLRPVRLAYQPPDNSTCLSEQLRHQQPANNNFLSERISTSQTNRLLILESSFANFGKWKIDESTEFISHPPNFRQESTFASM
jgi:hypothetical protein